MLLLYFWSDIRHSKHWGHCTVPNSFLPSTLKAFLVFLSSQPTIKLRECGHNQWSCWLTSQRPTSNALLRLIVSRSLNHKLAPSKVHDTSKNKSAVVKSTTTVYTILQKSVTLYLTCLISIFQYKGLALNTNYT